jgi:hypothetical protein
MSITFEIDGALAMLPETSHVLFDPEQARKSIEKHRSVRMLNAASRQQQ